MFHTASLSRSHKQNIILMLTVMGLFIAAFFLPRHESRSDSSPMYLYHHQPPPPPSEQELLQLSKTVCLNATGSMALEGESADLRVRHPLNVIFLDHPRPPHDPNYPFATPTPTPPPARSWILSQVLASIHRPLRIIEDSSGWTMCSHSLVVFGEGRPNIVDPVAYLSRAHRLGFVNIGVLDYWQGEEELVRVVKTPDSHDDDESSGSANSITTNDLVNDPAQAEDRAAEGAVEEIGDGEEHPEEDGGGDHPNGHEEAEAEEEAEHSPSMVEQFWVSWYPMAEYVLRMRRGFVHPWYRVVELSQGAAVKVEGDSGEKDDGAWAEEGGEGVVVEEEGGADVEVPSVNFNDLWEEAMQEETGTWAEAGSEAIKYSNSNATESAVAPTARHLLFSKHGQDTSAPPPPRPNWHPPVLLVPQGWRSSFGPISVEMHLPAPFRHTFCAVSTPEGHKHKNLLDRLEAGGVSCNTLEHVVAAVDKDGIPWKVNGGEGHRWAMMETAVVVCEGVAEGDKGEIVEGDLVVETGDHDIKEELHGDVVDNAALWEALEAGCVPVIVGDRGYRALPLDHPVPKIEIADSADEEEQQVVEVLQRLQDRPTLLAKQREIATWWEAYKHTLQDVAGELINAAFARHDLP